MPEQFVACGPDEVKGQVSGFSSRFEQTSRGAVLVWDFRVERWAADGTALARAAVEMRAPSFEGAISDGDWVEVPGKWKEGKLLHPDEVENLSSGTTVRPDLPPVAGRIAASLVKVIVLSLVLAGFAFTAYMILTTS